MWRDATETHFFELAAEHAIGMKPADPERALESLEKWARREGHHIVLEAGLSDAEIDAIPTLLERYPYPLAVPYRRGGFEVPPSYRALLRLHRAVRLEIEDEDESGAFEVFGLVELWAPSTKTMTASWVPDGTAVDDRRISTVDLVAFANGGFGTEASRWCFYTRQRSNDGEYPILIEDNDFECLTGHYADDDTPLSNLMKGPHRLSSFGVWFGMLCEIVPKAFDRDDPDAIPNALLTAKPAAKKSKTKRAPAKPKVAKRKPATPKKAK